MKRGKREVSRSMMLGFTGSVCVCVTTDHTTIAHLMLVCYSIHFTIQNTNYKSLLLHFNSNVTIVDQHSLLMHPRKYTILFCILIS